jgi:hypothetical protein
MYPVSRLAVTASVSSLWSLMLLLINKIKAESRARISRSRGSISPPFVLEWQYHLACSSTFKRKRD